MRSEPQLILKSSRFLGDRIQKYLVVVILNTLSLFLLTIFNTFNALQTPLGYFMTILIPLIIFIDLLISKYPPKNSYRSI